MWLPGQVNSVQGGSSRICRRRCRSASWRPLHTGKPSRIVLACKRVGDLLMPQVLCMCAEFESPVSRAEYACAGRPRAERKMDPASRAFSTGLPWTTDDHFCFSSRRCWSSSSFRLGGLMSSSMNWKSLSQHRSARNSCRMHLHSWVTPHRICRRRGLPVLICSES